MVSPDAKDFSSSKVKSYETIYIKNVKNDIAIVKYNQGWDNFFSQCEGAIKLLMEVLDAMTPEQKIIDLTSLPDNERKSIELQPLKVHNLFQLFWGGCKVSRKRWWKDPTKFVADTKMFHYDNTLLPKKRDDLLELIPVPSMDSMTPIGHIRDPTLMIQITEAVPVYIAWKGMDYDTIIREGGYYYKVGNKLVAKFPQSYLHSYKKKTHKVGRDFYHKTMRLQKRKFYENWIPVQNRIHKVIEFSETNIENLLKKYNKYSFDESKVNSEIKEMNKEEQQEKLEAIDTEADWT